MARQSGLLPAFALVGGLMFVNDVGAGTLAGLLITANVLMSPLIDKFGWFGMQTHDLTPGWMFGAAFMVAGIILISGF